MPTSELGTLLDIHKLWDIREVLWQKAKFDFGHLSGIGKLIEHPGGFWKVLTSEFEHFPGRTNAKL